MFHLQLTKALAASSFNAMVLAAIERDALSLAAMTLQKKNGGAPVLAADLIREANNLLPQANHGEAMRLFFATQHQLQDGGFDNTRDLGRFITERAAHVERLSARALASSESSQQWTAVLSDLAEAYSYVIEAAMNLAAHGMVAIRRSGDYDALMSRPADLEISPSGNRSHSELEALTTRPDDISNFAQAQLFDKASAFLLARQEEEKSKLREQLR